MSDLSVITIVRNRALHLSRLMAGLARSDVPPRELVVVDMSDVPVVLPSLEFPCRRVGLQTGQLPLAAARNLGARASSGQRLLFLDVDCIPRRNLLGAMDDRLVEVDALVCPEVRYLGPGGADHDDDAILDQHSVAHPVRSFPKAGCRRESNAGLFWSLTFGMRHAAFDALGGFDELYEGYGGEDTDFGFRAREADLPLLFLGGTGSFHQYHGVVSPPVQHVSDIVRNANLFFLRWGVWPMEGWLKQFAELGLVAFGGNALRLLRTPTLDEVRAATQPTSVYF